jgi:hypothetical protein
MAPTAEFKKMRGVSASERFAGKAKIAYRQ